MIEALKKRYKVGDVITIHTADTSFTGIIEAFEETCVVIDTADCVEFISNNSIIRFTAPKIEMPKIEEATSMNSVDEIVSSKEEIISEIVENENTNKVDRVEQPNENIESLKKLGINVVGKIDLDKLYKPRKDSSFQEKTYRLSKVSRELNIGIQIIVKELHQLGTEVDANPNTKISEALFLKLKDSLAQSNKNRSNKTENKDVLGIKLNSLEQLKQLKEKINIGVENQIIPANATIKRYGHLGYGYLTDQDNNDYYFRFGDVLDKELLNKLSDLGRAEGLQVICKLNSFKGRNTATDIILPKKLLDFQNDAEQFFKRNDYNHALHCIDLILLAFPEYDPALQLKKKIQIEKTKKERQLLQNKYSYNEAKTELKKGNISKAKELLIKAIELNDEKSEGAIKELSYLLQREGDIDSAIELVIKHAAKIKTSDSNSLVAYFYETKKDYSSALNFLNKVKAITKAEQVRLSKRKAIVYWGLSDFEGAEKSILFVLKEQPNDIAFNKFYEGIKAVKKGGSSEELEAIFNEAQLFSLTGGFSPFIQFSLEHCEYKGLPKEILAEEKYDFNALKSIRNYIEKAAGNRPIEKADFLLTEAKLMELITPEKEIELNEVLSKRSLALAEASALIGKSPDILRFFLLEAFRLAPDLPFVRNHLPIYFASYHLSSIESLKYQSIGWRESLKSVIEKNIGEIFWNGMVDVLLANSKIANSILTYLFQNTSFRNICYTYLSEEKILKSEKEQKERFIKIWNDKINDLKNIKSNWSLKLDSITNSKTSESFTENFNKTVFPIPNWISQTDSNRINTFNEINKSISEFNSQFAFEDKERYFNIILNQALQLRVEIEESPTELSFNILRKLLLKIESIINTEFAQLIETSKPEISISILGEGVLHEADLIVNLQVSVSNKKGSAPVSWLSLEIENTDDITFILANNVLDQTLKGGEERIIRLQVNVNPKIKDEGATNVKIKCAYKIRGSEDSNSFIENLSLRLYSEAEFVKIENCFAATADSGPVTDPNMFFGRDSFIENINNSILDSKSKCIIIYGQKRSGKSSVLYHLREKLLQTSNSFCISFSLGEILENLSSLTFYYKILSEMEDELETLSEAGISIPDFTAPSLAELKEAPSLVFNDYLKKFNKDISLLKEWEDKKLILLLDEFTYVYTAIQKKVLSDDFMKTWKSFLEKGFFTSVLVGQDIMPKFTEAYPNEFGVTEPKRLSYLDKDDAIKLIEIPIWDSLKNRSRFLGNAVNYILDYTSSNPYYIQIFCARLVDYMNQKKFISVTEADIIEVAQSLIKGEQSLSADKFDNLITAGDSDLEAFSPKDVLRALKEIAIASKNLDSCNREAINLNDKDYEEKILKDLKTREVISSPTTNYYKINVRLFKEWLLIN